MQVRNIPLPLPAKRYLSTLGRAHSPSPSIHRVLPTKLGEFSHLELVMHSISSNTKLKIPPIPLHISIKYPILHCEIISLLTFFVIHHFIFLIFLVYGSSDSRFALLLETGDLRIPILAEGNAPSGLSVRAQLRC